MYVSDEWDDETAQATGRRSVREELRAAWPLGAIDRSRRQSGMRPRVEWLPANRDGGWDRGWRERGGSVLGQRPGVERRPASRRALYRMEYKQDERLQPMYTRPRSLPPSPASPSLPPLGPSPPRCCRPARRSTHSACPSREPPCDPGTRRAPSGAPRVLVGSCAPIPPSGRLSARQGGATS